MHSDVSISKPTPLPWWTWIAPLVLIGIGDQLSLFFRYSNSYSAYYLPTSIAIVLVHWWGPKRVLPAMFIESTLNSWFYGINHVWLWPMFGFVETMTVFLSWYLFVELFKGKPWLPDSRQTISFIFLGLILPLFFEVACWEYLYSLDEAFPLTEYWLQFERDILSELIVNFSFTLPVLFFLTPKMNAWTLLYNQHDRIVMTHPKEKINIWEVILILGGLLVLTFILKFETFWYVYALFSLYLAIRFGFGMALICNAYLFSITYMIPALFQNLWYHENFTLSPTVTNTLLGTCLLYLFATITGRVITDLRIVENKLNQQNQELKDTNQELDRFVYSVSHDLSAPLKSILGLVNISKFSTDYNEHKIYFSKIESSVLKLDVFIREVLDYSYNKRLAITIEQIRLKDVCDEILENLRYMSNYGEFKIDFDGLDEKEIKNDKVRVKIILNNLLTNAIKYQKQVPGHKPFVKVSSRRKDNYTIIDVEDNGEGMRVDVQQKIFNMFFRGHENSIGSGLGLYIAKEVAERIDGQLTVKSEYGKGSIFTLALKDAPLN